MRNLKKFLALVLAMVMAFSLMLTASATTTGKDFSDASKIDETFVEAAEVLTGMKVFQGDEEAPTFRPTDKINRAEVAALIYRLATGDTGTDKMDLYTTTHPFTDVNANDWFAGYVGYCWNAGYIKGTTATTFNPYDQVTGYETLAMVLRAMGYDANNEFTGPNWIVNVSATATQRGLLVDVNKTHYANTLHQASAREVVASILFHAALKTRVKYTPAFGYQTGDHTSSSSVTDLYNDYSSLGWLNFGLTSTDQGVVIGNQQTGEKNTRLGYGRLWSVNSNGYSVSSTPYSVTSIMVSGSATSIDYSATPYTWDGTYDAAGLVNTSTGSAISADIGTITISGTNDIFNVNTGIDLIGHNIKIWFDGRPSSYNNTTGRPTYAYYDKATKTDVVTVKGDASTGDLNSSNSTNLASGESASEYANGERNLNDVAKDAGFKLASDGAVFNNSFGLFGSNFAQDDTAGRGDRQNSAEPIASPVRLYKLISNANLTKQTDQLDVVIALNIETSQITESNTVNRVPTIGVPVSNIGTASFDDTAGNEGTAQLETNFITDDSTGGTKTGENVKQVPVTTGTVTGVIAKDALVGNSTSTLGDYEFGVHITGTSNRAHVSSAEKTAINGTGIEPAYFLMAKVTPDVTGKVVAFNVNAGTVTLEDGTVLHRSKYYNTVANKNEAQYGKYRDTLTKGTISSELATADWALPQSTDQYGVESYNPTTYKFYMDFEGNYLGAERTHDYNFIYGTYLDYEQKTSSSTFTYYLTGIDLEGNQQTYPVEKYWKFDPVQDDRGTVRTITNTNEQMGWTDSANPPALVTGNYTGSAPVPFRDTVGSAGVMNYIGEGVYTGFTINGTTLDANYKAATINEKDYFVNMERLGIKNGKAEAIDEDETIGRDDTVIGAHKMKGWSGSSDLYLTEDTKFILVSGYGTDTAKGEVYDGITKLRDGANSVTINWDDITGQTDETTASKRLIEDTNYNVMTYFQHSPYIYAQSGDVDQKVDVVILPKEAVEWDRGTSTLYYMGDPNYSMISSHNGDPIYQYTVYKDGVPEKVWLTNTPSGTTNDGSKTAGVYADSFLVLGSKSSTLEPTTGGAVYTATFLDNAATLSGTTNHTNFAAYTAFKDDPRTGWAAMAGKNNIWIAGTNGAVQENLIYSATSRNAQAATFSWFNNSTPPTMNSGEQVLLRVAEAGVTNLNTSNAPSGQIWPGITDLATLNEAGSIDPVTGRYLKVAAQVDPSNPLVVTHIYVCWDQSVN